MYDDHDIGVNDADNRLLSEIQKQSQNLLLDFLDIDANDARRHRNGAYSVHKMDDVLVILLDTRTHRSPTVIPSIGKWEFPFFAFIASYLRYLTGSIGIVNHYKGTVLGEEQWKWFEEVLHSKVFQESNLVLIVSSTQIFTSNPYFESWGHFPSEKQRLIDSVRNAFDRDGNNGDNNPHILFISGDVHHSELVFGNEEYGPLEVTSSGLSHSLGGMSGLLGLKRKAALQITETYHPLHRMQYSNNEHRNGYYGRNMGVIDIVDRERYRLKIYDAVSGEVVIDTPLNWNKKISASQMLEEMQQSNRMMFPRKYPFYALELILPIVVLIALCVFYRIKVHGMTSKRPKLA